LAVWLWPPFDDTKPTTLTIRLSCLSYDQTNIIIIISIIIILIVIIIQIHIHIHIHTHTHTNSQTHNKSLNLE
jgi:hypothetical protein